MATDLSEVSGPIDYLLLQFPFDTDGKPIAAALLDLVRSGTIALYDLRAIRKETDGSYNALDLSELPDETVGGLKEFAGARSGLLDDDDIANAAAIMDNGTVAALMVYENLWAVPFVGAAFDAGAQVIASARIPATDVAAVLDQLEAADAAS